MTEALFKEEPDFIATVIFETKPRKNPEKNSEKETDPEAKNF